MKEIVNKMKRQPTEWEKIFANYMSDKALIYKVYKGLIQLNINKQTNNLIKKWAEELHCLPTMLLKFGLPHLPSRNWEVLLPYFYSMNEAVTSLLYA